MKIGPTLEGGLRIDVETAFDWMLLRCIPADARGAKVELADRLGELMRSDQGEEDWRDYVLPDLRSQFDGQISLIEKALDQPGEEPAEIVILRADGERWYGALNQARLALEARYHFNEDEDPDTLTPGKRTAWYRYNTYQRIQSLLLHFVMK